MSKINYFLFDCFQVIFSGIIDKWIRATFDKEKAELLNKTTMVELDRGDITYEESIRILSKESGKPYQDIYNEWHASIKPIKETIAFLKELCKEHNVYLLSNASAPHLYDVLATEPGVKEIFKRIYVSAEMRLVKPAPEFFEYVLSDLGAKPEECLFIDDNKRNTDAAKALGINVIQFLDFPYFRKEIEKYL